MKTLLLLTSVSLLSLSACKKEKNPLDTLPEATQIGANTVGWLQDGKAYQPTTDAFNSRAIAASRFTRRSRMYLRFTHNKGKLNRSIIFSVPYLRQPGVYLLDQSANPGLINTPAYGYYEASTPEPQHDYITGPAAAGQLIITQFDSVAQIVSGTFEFTAQETNGSATVRITDGRFDLRYE